MRIGAVIGTVTLSHRLESLAGGRLLLVQPLGAPALALAGAGAAVAEALVVYDELNPGLGARVAFSEGREAAMPFHPRPVPIDAYCAALLDAVQIERVGVEEHA
ncbi:MAG: carbon dioxide concentrating mechanism protein CcmL [Phycisphaerales bacterium]|nr:carbon dioxide concentrating mechanism protein CcmL [Phycisphaerales bacterium]